MGSGEMEKWLIEGILYFPPPSPSGEQWQAEMREAKTLGSKN